MWPRRGRSSPARENEIVFATEGPYASRSVANNCNDALAHDPAVGGVAGVLVVVQVIGTDAARERTARLRAECPHPKRHAPAGADVHPRVVHEVASRGGGVE